MREHTQGGLERTGMRPKRGFRVFGSPLLAVLLLVMLAATIANMLTYNRASKYPRWVGVSVSDIARQSSGNIRFRVPLGQRKRDARLVVRLTSDYQGVFSREPSFKYETGGWPCEHLGRQEWPSGLLETFRVVKKGQQRGILVGLEPARIHGAEATATAMVSLEEGASRGMYAVKVIIAYPDQGDGEKHASIYTGESVTGPESLGPFLVVKVME